MEEKIKEWQEQIGLMSGDLDIDGITNEEMSGALLLLMVHKGFNSQVWGNKRHRYWGAFTEKIELALGASNLAEFASTFAREMSNDIGRNERQRKVAAEIAYHANGEAIFERIRYQYEMLVTLARVLQEMIKAEYDKPDENFITTENNNEHN